MTENQGYRSRKGELKMFSLVRTKICLFAATVATVTIMAVLATTATANVIMVSGDSNIINGINSADSNFNSDNVTLFKNALQRGSNVVVQGTSILNPATSTTILFNFYNGLAGVSATSLTPFTAVTATKFAGVDLYVAAAPSHTCTAAEITDLSNFLAGGSSIFFSDSIIISAASTRPITSSMRP